MENDNYNLFEEFEENEFEDYEDLEEADTSEQGLLTEIERELEEGVYEDFSDDIEAIIKTNKHEDDFAKNELPPESREEHAKRNKIDIKKVTEKVKKELERRSNIEEKISEMDPNSAQTWALEDKQRERELKLKQRLTLNLARLDYDTLSDIADDASHLIEDGLDTEYRETRKDIRTKLKSLSPDEQEEMIESLLENGQIDRHQYYNLKNEFL